MLRILFNEPERIDSGAIKQTNIVLAKYVNKLTQNKRYKKSNEMQVWLAWTQSIMTALDELEQSLYCSEKYGELIKSLHPDQMSPEEQLNYRRHLYFYKNSFIRLFSILDKLGYYLNRRLKLNTEKIKPRFSYFTVLRRMRSSRVNVGLEQTLYQLKEKYQEALSVLRDQRNAEIHSFNYEAMDDLVYARKTECIASVKQIENLTRNRHYLRQGFEMVCLTLRAIFKNV